MKDLVCYGEVLWDVFPKHKKIGGAPLNVAIRLQSLGNNVEIISCIGKDKRGDKINTFLLDQGINTDNLQVNEKLKTGNVKVILNQKGSASYDIKFPRAWDNIQLTESAKHSVKNADAFIYGSLVARDDTSRNTLYQLLKIAKYKIFDINLREPYYTIDLLKYLMNEADFIKFNDDEIFEIGKALNSKTHSLEQNIKYIASITNTQSICVTKGKHGAILYYNEKFYYNSGYQIEVIDTVGAGDSFLATLVDYLINSKNPQEAINIACAVGALVAGSEGANPKLNLEIINKFVNQN
ncbi:carbohydrate kinase family protein [uncultured Winogradskyella sp.]|uniref:carbohydrate kinase family protein n=1 Tax=Winogradskyella sp. 4-2091 TaxID=3381659 RepID=UPI00260D2153|nr:PfkB family carbohydrate kinase [uncultured Winogradskyella sp.]